ncbi:MAG: hypothetical protein NTW97_04950, partial [Candidatus Krumholzibacteria bacterium]|nr:hypothetical protein [Candidatus Krumholzibacteria bacterium]
MKKRCVAIGLVLALSVLASCIFQNNPLEPNNPPMIRSYTPQETFFSLTAPDSCVFSIGAVDPDGDDIMYMFVSGDSVLSRADTAKFYAIKPGRYDIRGEARDGTTKAFREWQVTVLSKDNEPPRITSLSPEQAAVACAIGDTLEFRITAEDDHPQDLQYFYLLDGAILQSGSSVLAHRFMERGDFLVAAVAWDGQYGDTVRWDIGVAGFPDTIAPAPIIDLAGGFGEIDGSISLVWTAPGDDGNAGRAACYVVKTSTYPILTEADWSTAEGKPGEPVPSEAGTVERMTIKNLISASYVYVGMRAVDDFFNMSPIGNYVKVLVRGIDIGGRTIDAATGEPVQGIEVLTSSKRDTSDEDGLYIIRNIPSYTTSVVARDENVLGHLGDYFNCSSPITTATQIDKDFYMIPAYTLVSTVQPDQYEGRFLAFYKEITKTDGYIGRPTVYVGWNHWPITVYNPPQMDRGMDLQVSCRNALADWEQSTGCDLFVEVFSAEGADVVVKYDTLSEERHHVATPAYNADGTPARKEIYIYTKNTEVPLS